jgi:GNAT superfamily N-acetyltransferase
MEQITTRTATLDDLETLLTFEQGIISAERPFDPTLKDGHINYYDIAYMISAPHIEVIVATIGPEIIASGYGRIETSKVYVKHRQHTFLGFMYVKPEHRGKGVNKLIIDALKQWSISHNITEMRLEVYDDNEPAVKAYKKVGFSGHLLQMRMGLS